MMTGSFLPTHKNGRLAALTLVLSACGQQPAAPSNQAGPQSAEPAPSPPAEPFAVEVKADDFEFDFAWPAEAAAIPELVKVLRAEMDRRKAELTAGAEEEHARRDQAGFDFHPFMSSTVYEAVGQSARLLSLRVDVGGYEGGAHGNFGVGSRLWDRRSITEIDVADLFVDRSNRDRLLTQRWCDALNQAREEKRGEPVGGGGLFDDCPALDDIAIMPVDSDKDGKFERLLFVASPYVAGPWVEGAYEVELAVTPDLIAVLKSEFRPSFVAQGTQ